MEYQDASSLVKLKLLEKGYRHSFNDLFRSRLDISRMPGQGGRVPNIPGLNDFVWKHEHDEPRDGDEDDDDDEEIF